MAWLHTEPRKPTNGHPSHYQLLTGRNKPNCRRPVAIYVQPSNILRSIQIQGDFWAAMISPPTKTSKTGNKQCI